MSFDSDSVLLVRASAQVCALPLRHVAETMRRLPVTRLPDLPACVEGAAVARGEAVPVVSLGALLGGGGEQLEGRFVLVRAGDRRALLAVDEVIGVAAVDRGRGVPLLGSAAGGVVAALGARDRDLLAVLEASRLVPEEAWRAVERGTA